MKIKFALTSSQSATADLLSFNFSLHAALKTKTFGITMTVLTNEVKISKNNYCFLFSYANIFTK